jgi:hypothetical protein
VGRIGEEGLVLLHTGAAEERGIVVRPYGLNACVVDAFGKAVVTIVLDQASRGVIGNLLLVQMPASKIEKARRDCKKTALPALRRRRSCAATSEALAVKAG